jgi:hypothetical protein
LSEKGGVTGGKMREARVSVVFVVGGVIPVRGSPERDSGLLLAGGSRRGLLLAHTQAQGGDKTKFGAFCAVRQYLGELVEIGGSLPVVKVFKNEENGRKFEKKTYLRHLNIQFLLIKVCL